MTEKSSRVMAARGTYSYDTVGANPGAVHFLTTIIIAFNVFFAILGATMLALGFWLTLDITFKNWVIDLGMERFWVGVYILMAAGVLVMLQSFFGICGAFQRKGRMLVVFCGSLVICFVLEIVGGTYMLANGIQHSLIEDWLHNRFYHFIDVFDQDEGARRIMNIIQQYVSTGQSEVGRGGADEGEVEEGEAGWRRAKRGGGGEGGARQGVTEWDEAGWGGAGRCEAGQGEAGRDGPEQVSVGKGANCRSFTRTSEENG
ncbi:CD9 antigen-like [Homarus americanus]|uniref:CD9 antigen-like n=1 Tax=Homarus americanus TaxID=6706 RepID=A0A8J5MTE6_HOMAM|nr:CD9 antigen-like [Homarus americanus]